jgi:hypothetical protein
MCTVTEKFISERAEASHVTMQPEKQESTEQTNQQFHHAQL